MMLPRTTFTVAVFSARLRKSLARKVSMAAGLPAAQGEHTSAHMAVIPPCAGVQCMAVDAQAPRQAERLPAKALALVGGSERQKRSQRLYGLDAQLHYDGLPDPEQALATLLLGSPGQRPTCLSLAPSPASLFIHLPSPY